MFRLTTTEAVLLRALGRIAAPTLYQIASETRLTPSEVKAAVERLVRKHLVRSESDRDFALTDEGVQVRRILEGPGAGTRSSAAAGVSPSSAPRVVVVPDEAELGRPEPAGEGQRLDPEALDAALDAAVERVRAEETG